MTDSNFLGFYLMVTGQVSHCEMQGVDNLYCKYNIKYNKDWKYMHGLEYGMSQIAKSVGTDANTFMWNYPIELTMRSTNPYGWPQLVISVYGFNALGRDVVRGYGFVHVPTTPGRHIRRVRLYTPRSSSRCQQIIAWFTGNPPEFFDCNFVAQGKGREVTRVQSNGFVEVHFNVMTKNMKAFGYSVNDSTTTTFEEEIGHEKAA